MSVWVKRSLTTALFVALAAFLPRLVSGQNKPSGHRVNVGERIRIVVRDSLLTGSVSEVRGDTLIIVSERDTAHTIMSALQGLEISLGKSRLMSGGYGAIIGGALGGLGGYLMLRDVTEFLRSPNDQLGMSSMSSAPTGNAGLKIGAILGGVAGFAVGALVAPERWKRVVPGSARMEARFHHDAVQFHAHVPLRPFREQR